MFRTRFIFASLVAVVGLIETSRAEDVPVFRIVGSVLDAQDLPVSGVSARFLVDRSADPNDPRSTVFTATSDASGSFEITVGQCHESGRLLLEKDGLATTILDRVPAVTPVLALGALRILPPVEFHGRLVDAAGKAIPGGRVHLSLEPDPALASSRKVVTTISDADGRFALPNLPAAALTFEVDALGFETRCESIDLRDRGSRDRTISMRPAPVLAGRVVDPKGQPVEGARVSRSDGAFPSLFAEIETTTGAGGEFTLPAPRRSDRQQSQPVLVARAAGFPTLRTEIDFGLERQELRLTEGVPATLRLFEGEKVDAEIASIHYSVFTKAGEGWSHQEGEILDGTWTAAAEHPKARRFVLPRGDRARVFAKARDGRVSNSIEIDLHSEVKDGFQIDVSIPALVHLEGSVVGPTGQPVAGILVELGKIGEQAFFPRAERVVRTNADGKFAFDGVPAGAWSARARSEDALSEPIPVRIDDTAKAPLTLKAARAPSAAGSLKINDAIPPHSVGLLALRFQRQGAQGSYIPVASTLAKDGKYRLAPLPLGAFAIEPLRTPEVGDGSWHDFKTTLDAIDPRGSQNQITIVEAGERTLDIQVRREARGFVNGTLSINGVARAGTRLALIRQVRLGAPPVNAIPAITDGFGRFRTRLDGKSLYRVEALVGVMRAGREFEFDPEQDLELDLDLPAGSIHGKFDFGAASAGPFRAVLEGEMSDSEKAIRLANPTNVDDTPWATRAEAVVGESGDFQFPEIQTGRFRIALEDTSRTLARVASAPFEVEAGKQTTLPALAAPRGGVLQVDLLKPDDIEKHPFASLKVTAADGEPALPRTFVGWFVGGTATTDGIPKAKLKVEVIVFGPYVVESPKVVEIDPDAGPLRVQFTVSKKP